MPASYSLGKHFEQFVRGQVKSGRFASASEVVREGLRLMEEREAEREARLQALRVEIVPGRASGPGLARADVLAEARARVDEKRARPGPRRKPRLDREGILKRLREHAPELKAMGIKRLSLFGSVARDEAGPQSDVDLAAELDHGRPFGLFEFAGLQERLGELLGAKVDLVSEPIRKDRFRARVEEDRVHVF